jgi:uncharacterized Zn-binding protein involved in type VI secretion
VIRLRNLAVAAMSVISGAGCAQLPNPPLIFGQTHTVGITIAGSPAEQGGEFTLGYRDRDLAVVPVSVTQGDGTVTQLETYVFGDHRSGADQPDKDAFSVLGQFELSTEGQQAKVGLGKFFATGLAARRLGDGFACALSEGKEAGCTPSQGDSGAQDSEPSPGG